MVAMTRHPDSYGGAGRAVFGDVHDPATLAQALTGAQVAYYLVHSLDSADFERLDAQAARSFGEAAAAAGIQRIVYLGGLGRDRDDLSPHLRSRREVERLLAAGGVPVTTLRAGIVIGHGGLSWEMTRQLVERLPVMVTPRWVSTRTQPIALTDVVRYLVAVPDVPETTGRAFEVGGPEVLRYRDMMRTVARIEERRLRILPVPVLSPRLSAHWLGVVTDVDAQAGRSLIDSMVNEVVVDDDTLHRLVPFRRATFEEAVRAALEEGRADRRQAGILAHRRRFVGATAVAASPLLAYGLSVRPGSRAFYLSTFGVAAIDVIGALNSGTVPSSRRRIADDPFHELALPVGTGLAAFAVFRAGAEVARRIPWVAAAVASVLQYAEEGDPRLVLVTTLANGAAEEVFFRGALFDAFDHQHAVLRTTVVYALATLPTRNPVLVAAATAMGALWAAQRARTGGVRAPMLTHLTWSSLMVRRMPPLFHDARPATSGVAAV